MTRLLILALVFCVACDKKSKQAPQPTTTGSPPEAVPAKKSTPAPKGVPQQLKDMVDSTWPKIQVEADAFLQEFTLASKAKAVNDRASMDKSVNAASLHYNKAADMWAEIAYWPSNELKDDKQIDACERFLRKWEHKVQGWAKKAKGLKEFSRVK